MISWRSVTLFFLGGGGMLMLPLSFPTNSDSLIIIGAKIDYFGVQTSALGWGSKELQSEHQKNTQII